MSIHDNLLRLQQWQLDDRRRYAAELEALSERLRADLGLLQAAIALESDTLDRQPQTLGGGRPVILTLRERQKKLEHSVAEIENQIAAARAAVAAAENEIAACNLAAALRKPVTRAVSTRLSQAHRNTAGALLVRGCGS